MLVVVVERVDVCIKPSKEERVACIEEQAPMTTRGRVLATL